MDEVRFTKEFWDQRYASAHKIWSGNPNATLVTNVADLPPGRALDVGCGEGGDAIWLAGRGWTVTALDLSDVAVARATAHAAQAGVGDRVHVAQADLETWEPDDTTYDLVSAQFVHLPPGLQARVHKLLQARVAPGGTLLLAGHAVSDLHTSIGRPNQPELFWSAAAEATTLDPDEWTVLLAEDVPRTATDGDGHVVEIADTVLRAVRRPAPGFVN